MSFAYGFGLPHWHPLSGAFSPLSLFSGGVQGAFYDPSDATTLFSDRAGTTPCGTPGGGSVVPVGLMLDKSQGLVLGPELVTNGDFSQGATGWTVGTDWSISSGQASHVAGASLSNLFIATPLFVSGLTYQLTIDIVSISGGNLTVFCGDASSITFNTPGTKTMRLRAAGDLRLYIQAAAATVVTVDNISAKLIAGNHAIAANDTTARPELRARVNLLTYSEQFDNAAWTKTRTTVSANTTATTDPLGGNTADKIVEGVFVGNDCSIDYSLFTHTASVSYTLSVYAKAAERTRVVILWSIVGANNPGIIVDLSTGTAAFTNGSPTVSISNAGNGWWRIALTVTSGTPVTNTIRIGPTANTTSFTGTLGYNGNGTSGIYIWGAQLTATNEFPANTYQRISDANTYDAVGFPRYLACNGTSSAMSTPGNIPFATVTSDGQARRNLLSNPTQFDVAATWSGVTNVSVSANSTAAPDGTTTADTLIEAATTSTHWLGAAPSSIPITTVQYTLSIYAKDNGRRYFQVYFGGGASPVFYGNFDLVGLATGSSSAATTLTISDAGNGWRRCSITFTSVASGATSVVFALINSASAAALASYTGDGTSGVFIWGAQLETGSTATAFQNIGTDKATVFAGVRKNADVSIIAEFSANAGANNGAFLLATGGWAAENGTYVRQSRGTATAFAQPAANSYPSPRTDVLTGTSDIAGDSVVLRVNGTQAATSATDQGTGNYGSYPLFIGSRNNASTFLNGNIYSLIVVGSAVSAGQISATEQWVAQRTGITI